MKWCIIRRTEKNREEQRRTEKNREAEKTIEKSSASTIFDFFAFRGIRVGETWIQNPITHWWCYNISSMIGWGGVGVIHRRELRNGCMYIHCLFVDSHSS
jgi:hypothetical protein